MAAALLLNIKLSILADYFNVESLKKLAVSTFLAGNVGVFPSPGFYPTAPEAFGDTLHKDVRLRYANVKHCLENSGKRKGCVSLVSMLI